MKFELSAPSKTFLLGEYLALNGGGAILLTTNPRFKLIATKTNTPFLQTKGIEANSPAGNFIKENENFFCYYDLQFEDPYQGIGGFGASTAQFLLVYALKQKINDNTIDPYLLLNDYIHYAWQGEGIKPSGADLIAQLHGEICFFEKQKKVIQTFSWPFADLSYCVIHTGNKLATHVHLKNLSSFDTLSFEKIVQDGLAALKNDNGEGFITAINAYNLALQKENLVATETKKILDCLKNENNILAAKGCGALGNDVIFALFEREHQESVSTFLQNKNLRVIQFGQDVAVGLQVAE